MTDDEDVLLDQLRRIADLVEGRPAFVDAAARAALDTRTLDAELAELVLDSATAGGHVRGGEPSRLVSFRTATVTVELELREAADEVVLRGAVSGAGGVVVVETPRERHTVPIDADGWFDAGPLPRTALRLRLHPVGGAPVTTGWLTT